MKRGIGASLVGALLLILMFATPSSGTTVTKLSLPEVASRAARIVELKVDGVSVARDLRGRPATRVSARVLTHFKGDATKTVEWIQPGGTIDGETLLIPGIPQFTSGEECILFLSGESTAGLRMPVGLGQGAFRERLNAKTGETLVRAEAGAVELFDPATGRKTEAGAVDFERGAFITEIRRLLQK